MISAILLVLVGAVLAWAAHLYVHARRAEHVVVLKLVNGATATLARQADGRYELVGPLGVPAALARYEALRTRERLARVRNAFARPSPRAGRAAVQMH